jgi:hypothetical protein
MKKIKLIAGIIWAFLGLALIIILFPKLMEFSKSVANLPFMKINPIYSGGDIAFRTIQQGCTLAVHKPVFNGLIRERNTGFVQVDWKGRLSEKLVDTIDYDQDAVPDFCVSIDTKESNTKLVPLSRETEGVDVSTPTSYGWALRVRLNRSRSRI